MENENGKIIIKGKVIDDNTRCVHYHSPLDTIAIKFKCCGHYYPCYFCHREEADHAATIWRKTELDERAILCGVCSTAMTIAAYKVCNYQCPFCNASFNPKCADHDHLYFEQ
jgi:uncharacterized CHY-type Zn-finger protein